jgi:ABC-type sugar transport system ATPase subunit
MVQADAPPVIELRGIDKSFGDVHAIGEVPLESLVADMVARGQAPEPRARCRITE